jgi:DNA-binding response OmpR family regulator
MFSFWQSGNWPELPVEEIRKRARLLVIDDQEFPYLPLFNRDGYNIEKWSDVDDLQKLESGFYDLILLDLQGVGKQHTIEQGLGILRHLRSSRPAQIIIAFSSADWPLKYQEFFNQADAVLQKGADYVSFKQRVDALLRERFSLGFYLARVRGAVAPHIEDVDKVEKLVRKSIKTGNTSKLQKFLEQRIPDGQTVSTIMSVVQTAITIASLWKT